MEHMHAVVTAGGTSEPIDDVRAITNISTGRFGHALAVELANQGVSTTELCPRNTTQLLGSEPGVAYEHFDTAGSLRNLLVERSDKPDIILHAAAVSDYKPVRLPGKVPSDQDSITIKLERTPKIISELRQRYGSETFIAGFKLLSGVSESELIGAAIRQLRQNRLNMVIANDLQQLQDGQHPVLAVTPEGGCIPFTGERLHVAQELARFVLRRSNVDWFKSIEVPETHNTAVNTSFGRVLTLAHRLNLLNDESGNVSNNEGNGKLIVSPRQVDKRLLTENDGIAVSVDLLQRITSYSGSRKPSIDTGVSSQLYREYPELTSIIHFHNGWGRMSAKTGFPYPCGVVQEADEIVQSVQRAKATDIAVELVDHGFLLGLRQGDRERLQDEWHGTKTAFLMHLDEIHKNHGLRNNLLKPIFDGLSVAGIIYDQPEGAAVYLPEHTRGTGLGGHVLRQLIKRQYKIQTVDDCQVRDFYKNHGFTEVYSASSASYVLTPPVRKLAREFTI